MNYILPIIAIGILSFAAVVLLFKPLDKEYIVTKNRMKNILDDTANFTNTNIENEGQNIDLRESDENKNKSPIKRFAEWLNAHNKENKKRPLTKDDNEIKKMLAMANLNISIGTFAVLRLILGFLFSMITYFVLSTFFFGKFNAVFVILFMVSFGLFGTLIPKSILGIAVKKRKEAIITSMSNCIDLLAISVEAGMGYDAAILRIWERDKSPAMQEIVRTMLDINHGISRKDAYAALAARCGVDEMSQFASNMAQADALGISIVNVLKSQAEALRDARRLRAETFIQKAPVKMTLPLVLCIFPAILIVILAPALVSLSSIF